MHVTSPYDKEYSCNFCDNRMYIQSARAAFVLSTQSCFSSFEEQYQVFNGLDGRKDTSYT